MFVVHVHLRIRQTVISQFFHIEMMIYFEIIINKCFQNMLKCLTNPASLRSYATQNRSTLSQPLNSRKKTQNYYKDLKEFSEILVSIHSSKNVGIKLRKCRLSFSNVIEVVFNGFHGNHDHN